MTKENHGHLAKLSSLQQTQHERHISPITPKAFLAAIKDLELEQLHAEAARLRNSLYHLARSNIVLQEFQNDPELKEAIDDNEIPIQRQKQRVQMIIEEIQRRVFPTDHVILGNAVNAVNGEGRSVDREGGGQEEEDGDPIAIARLEPPAGVREEEVNTDDLGEGGVSL